MNISVEKIISLPFIIQAFRVNKKKQKQFICLSVSKDLEEIVKDNSLTEKDIKKIRTYYGLAVPAYLGEGFCLLREKEMSELERHQLTYLGALTGLFDDFFDEKNTSNDHIKELINSPSANLATNTHEALFIKFYLKALSGNNTSLIKEYFKRVYDAQVLSKQQLNPEIDRETIKAITYQKGGISILFYRSIFEGVITETEHELLYYLGALGQLENDIFDVYKDRQQNINTLPTTEQNILNLRSEYVSLFNEVLFLLQKTNFTKRGKNKFLKFIFLIGSRGLVCLDALEQISKKTNGEFILESYSRMDLICDMGTIKNQWKLFKYYIKKQIY